MANGTENEKARGFMVSTEIFFQPGLDIYAQMVFIILRSYSAESSLPALADIAKQGRMTAKQAVRALQCLVELGILSHKVFRQMIGEFEDDRLSWAAKGLLTYFKENPHIKIGGLLEMSSQSGEDEQSIRRALKELGRFGYLEEYPELGKLAN